MINLLPPKYKKELKVEELQKIALILSFIFLFFLASISLILFSIKIYAQGQARSLEVLVELEKERIEKPKTLELREEIVLADKSLEKLTSFFNSSKSTIDVFKKIEETLPDDLFLTSFSWDKSSSQVTLTGFSPTREILFEFKENLEVKEGITRVSFPPAVWTIRTIVEFSVTFNIEI